MRSFIEGFKRGWAMPDGAVPPPQDGGPGNPWDDGQSGAVADQRDGYGDERARLFELEEALEQERHARAQAEASVKELEALVERQQTEKADDGAAVVMPVLMLPGVKAWLLNRFHPDKFPRADAVRRQELTDALQTINAAYDHVERTVPRVGDNEFQRETEP
jgi:hypothetical protein